MKNLFMILSLTLLICSGCNGFSERQGDLKGFIPGTYVRSVQNEYSIGVDTLVLTELSTRAGTYSITRKSAFQRIRDNKLQPPKHTSETWIANYNVNSNTLIETRKSAAISFIPEKSILILGHSEYHKIK